MDDFDRGERRSLYGANELVIPVGSPLALAAAEMIHPFFIFQYASVAIWCAARGAGRAAAGHQRARRGAPGREGRAEHGDPAAAAAAAAASVAPALTRVPLLALRCPPRSPHTAPRPRRCAQAYYSYSAIIVGMTLFSILTNVASAYQYRRRLAALAHYTCEVQVRAAGRLQTVDSTDLLPGDVVVVHPGVLPCDLALIRRVAGAGAGLGWAAGWAAAGLGGLLGGGLVKQARRESTPPPPPAHPARPGTPPRTPTHAGARRLWTRTC